MEGGTEGGAGMKEGKQRSANKIEEKLLQKNVHIEAEVHVSTTRLLLSH